MCVCVCMLFTCISVCCNVADGAVAAAAVAAVAAADAVISVNCFCAFDLRSAVLLFVWQHSECNPSILVRVQPPGNYVIYGAQLREESRAVHSENEG